MTSPTNRASRSQSRHPVIERLLADGDRVCAPPVAGRSLTADAVAIRGFVERIDGPVPWAGHSYGGAVITVAGTADSATPTPMTAWSAISVVGTRVPPSARAGPSV